MKRFVALAVAALLVLAACGAGDEVGEFVESSTSTTSEASQTTVTTSVEGSLPRNTVPGRFDPADVPITGGEMVTGEVPQDILDAIVADAGERTGRDDIEVLVAEAVIWNDGSLGCPEPGMLYTMALVEGYRVVVEAGDEQLDYRVGAGGSFRICEGIAKPLGGGEGRQPTG